MLLYVLKPHFRLCDNEKLKWQASGLVYFWIGQMLRSMDQRAF